jgi:hypothetical protein
LATVTRPVVLSMANLQSHTTIKSSSLLSCNNHHLIVRFIYSQTCLSNHLYIATTCTSDHLFSTPLHFPYIIYLYIETTSLTRPATKRFPTKTVANLPITTSSLSVRQAKVTFE